MIDSGERLRQGIAALKAGRKGEARGLLLEVLEEDESNEQAWLWMSGAVETDKMRRTCLEKVLEINPDNQQAIKGLRQLGAAAPAEKTPHRESQSRNWVLLAGTGIAVGILLCVAVGFAWWLTRDVVQPAHQLGLETTQLPTPSPSPTTSSPTSIPIVSKERSPNKWEVEYGRSSFDDSQTVVLALEAEKLISGWLETYRPILVLRCREHEIEAYIKVGMSQHVESGLHDLSTVRVRFDKDPAMTMKMSHSTDGEALFFRQPIEMIEHMLNHDLMAFEFTPFNAPPDETEFDLRGLEQEIAPLIEACGGRRPPSTSTLPGAGSTAQAAPAASPTPYPTLAPTPTPLPSGSPIVIDDWQIRVDRVLTAQTVESKYSDSIVKAEGRFVLAFMAVTNRGLYPRTFAGVGHIAIQDAEGRKYEEAPLATMYAMDQYQTDIPADINPDETIHVVSVFDISEHSAYYLLVPGLLASEYSAPAVSLAVP